jgi:lipoate-protein ligase A
MPAFWRLFKDLSKPLSTAEGLAIDDALPHAVEHNQSPPILHLYTFRPSAIVGKYQDIRAALRLDRCRDLDIEINRRSTGGGTVIMGPEIVALGLGINADYPGLQKGIKGLFESLSQVLANALKTFGIQARFRPKNDLEVNGQKIAGLSAAAETGKSLLFHTSLLVNFDIPMMLEIMNSPLIKLQDKGYSCFSQRITTIRRQTGKAIPIGSVVQAIQDSFEDYFHVRFKDDIPDAWEQETIDRLIQERFTNPEWIFSHKHPRSRMGIGRVKSPGGLVEIYLMLAGGSIENVIITGDFFSTSANVTRLENALKWTSVQKENIEQNLAKVWHDDMIYGLDMITLTRAILDAKENQVRL